MSFKDNYRPRTKSWSLVLTHQHILLHHIKRFIKLAVRLTRFDCILKGLCLPITLLLRFEARLRRQLRPFFFRSPCDFLPIVSESWRETSGNNRKNNQPLVRWFSPRVPLPLWGSAAFFLGVVRAFDGP